MRFFKNHEAIECTKGIGIKLVYLRPDSDRDFKKYS